MKTAPAGLNIAMAGKAPVRALPDWYNWMIAITDVANHVRASGITSKRPTTKLFVGRTFFDTTLGKPIWYDGTNWVDATGATV